MTDAKPDNGDGSRITNLHLFNVINRIGEAVARLEERSTSAATALADRTTLIERLSSQLELLSQRTQSIERDILPFVTRSEQDQTQRKALTQGLIIAIVSGIVIALASAIIFLIPHLHLS